MATAVDIVNTYYLKLQEDLKNLNTWKTKLADAQTNVTELERQVKFHRDNGDTANADIASNRLASAYGVLGEAKNNVPKLEALYKDSEALYMEKKTALLTDAEQTQLSKKFDADLAQQNADTAALKAKADLEASNSSFYQKNHQTILFVGIALVVIVVGSFVYFKFKKQRP